MRSTSLALMILSVCCAKEKKVIVANNPVTISFFM
jgi:hypothetical protein